MLLGVLYVGIHPIETISTIWDGIKTTYQEEGLLFCIGYIVPEIAAYYFGVGEVKGVEELGLIGRYVDDVADLGRVADDVADVGKVADDLDDLGKVADDVAAATDNISNIPSSSLDGFPQSVQDSYNKYADSSWTDDGKPNANTRGKKTYNNNNGQLPEGDYEEFRVNAKDPVESYEDGERFVRDKNTGDVYYTDDHYGSFTKIN